MAMKLMFVTNDVQVAQSAERAGVDRIFVDLETVGKQARQGGLDTVQSHHTVEDVHIMRASLTSAELFVRVNQIYPGSEKEIQAVIQAGADVVMLPYFKTVEQVREFLRYVDEKTRTCLLFETVESVRLVDEILALDGIDECYIGLNDLHLESKRTFMFELLADGTVEGLCKKFSAAGKPYGFGGIARIGTGTLSADCILGEHVRLGSSIVILSRSFCNVAAMDSMDEVREVFAREVPKLRNWEETLRAKDAVFFAENQKSVQTIVAQIVESMK